MAYLPYVLALIGVCLAAYAWQNSVRLARLSQTDEHAAPQVRPKFSAPSRLGYRISWLVFGVVATVVLIASFYLDDAVARLVEEHSEGGLRTAGGFVSHYGDWPEHMLLGSVLWILAYFLRSRRWQRIILMMILASILGGLTADVVRGVTGRPRPSTQVADGWYGPHLDYKYNAFPSGHAAASTAFFAVLLFVEGPIGAVALIIPLAVATARILVDAHHFSDIVGSVIVGVVAAMLRKESFVRAPIDTRQMRRRVASSRMAMGLPSAKSGNCRTVGRANDSCTHHRCALEFFYAHRAG